MYNTITCVYIDEKSRNTRRVVFAAMFEMKWLYDLLSVGEKNI